MTYAIIISIAIIFLVLVIYMKEPNFIIALMGSASWILLWWFYLNNPVASIPMDSVGSNVIVISLGIMTFSPLLITFMRIKNINKEKTTNLVKEWKKENPTESYSETGHKKTLSELSPSEYRDMVHHKLHSKR